MHRHTQIEGSRPHWRRHATSASGAHRNCSRRAAPMRLASPWAPHRRGARRQSGLQVCLLWNSRRTPVVPRHPSHSRPRRCDSTATRRRTLGLAAAAAAKGRDQPASAANGAATRPLRGLKRSAPGPRARHRMRAAMLASRGSNSSSSATASSRRFMFWFLCQRACLFASGLAGHRPF